MKKENIRKLLNGVRITHLLFVDDSKDSKAAIALCQKTIQGLRIIKAEPAMQPPRLVAPEGKFISLEKMRDYVTHFAEKKRR